MQHSIVPITLRPMTDADLPAVMEIEASTTLPQWPVESWHFELHEKYGAHFFVGVDDGTLIGYAGMWVVADDAEVAVVATRTSHRRQGVAELLLRHLLDLAGESGVRNIFLEVRVSNREAQNLYRKLGFEPSHVRAGYYKDGEDALVMQRTLSPAAMRAG